MTEDLSDLSTQDAARLRRELKFLDQRFGNLMTLLKTAVNVRKEASLHELLAMLTNVLSQLHELAQQNRGQGNGNEEDAHAEESTEQAAEELEEAALKLGAAHLKYLAVT